MSLNELLISLESFFDKNIPIQLLKEIFDTAEDNHKFHIRKMVNIFIDDIRENIGSHMYGDEELFQRIKELKKITDDSEINNFTDKLYDLLTVLRLTADLMERENKFKDNEIDNLFKLINNLKDFIENNIKSYDEEELLQTVINDVFKNIPNELTVVNNTNGSTVNTKAFPENLELLINEISKNAPSGTKIILT